MQTQRRTETNNKAVGALGIWAMSKQSQELRDRAAEQIRAARKSFSARDKAEHCARAAAFKELAHNEEWLSGENEHSGEREPDNGRSAGVARGPVQSRSRAPVRRSR